MIGNISKALFSNLKIIKGKYLIEAPPKRALNGYAIFCQEQFLKNKSNPEFKLKNVAEKWKTLPEPEKQFYLSKSENAKKSNQPIMEDYEKKFIVPFKNINYMSLAIQKHMTGKKLNSFSEYGQEISKIKTTLNQFSKRSFEEEAKKVMNQRHSIRQKYEIPSPQYASFNSYLKIQRKSRDIPHLKDIKKAELTQFKKQYAAVCEAYDENLQNFATKFGITAHELKKMIKKNQRKIQKEKESKDQNKDTKKQENQN